MKTAVLISGKSEDFKYFYDSIYNTLIKPYNSDVFISTWYIDDNTSKELIELYKPVSIKIEKFDGLSMKKRLDKFEDFLFTISHNKVRKITKSVFPMFYKIYDANQLRLNYHNVKYDLVIRTRFDLNFNEKMNCCTIEPFVFNSILDEEIQDIQNHLYLRLDPFWGGDKQVWGNSTRCFNNWIWDQFAFGNDHNMNVYCNTFLNLERILLTDREDLDVNEMVLYYNLIDNNIPVKHTHTTYRINKYV